MVLHSTRWLALSYFTYFFSYGIFLPFWSVWLAGNGLTPETIGILLGAGLVARFLGSLLIAPRVSDPSRLIAALRVLGAVNLALRAGLLGRQPRSMAAGDHHRLQPVLFAAGAADGCSGQHLAKADHHGPMAGCGYGALLPL
ncbi:3-phenylpropionic acid transporter [Klebsiella pneumoniae]|nr:3-phenylpropionic acid transporter [Klebsiella pneumoniae]